MQIPGVVTAGHFKSIECTDGTNLQRFDTKPHVIKRAGWRRHIEDIVNRSEVEGLADIVLLELETTLVLEMLEVLKIAGSKIVYAEDLVPLGEKHVTEMRS